MDSVLRTVSDGRYVTSMVQVESGTNVQKARNDCVRWFLENTESEFLVFVDTDMVWAPDVIERLIMQEVPICSALYLGRGHDGKAFPVGMRWEDEGLGTMGYLTMEYLDGLTEVAGVGMGCCVIRREVLEALATFDGHPDQWPFAQGQTRSAKGGFLSMSEDITFCVRAKKAGFESYIDERVVAGHVKTFVMAPESRTEAKLRGAPEHAAPFTEVVEPRA
jgi:hypothetical protein